MQINSFLRGAGFAAGLAVATLAGESGASREVPFVYVKLFAELSR
jgi:hypothetical protein